MAVNYSGNIEAYSKSRISVFSPLPGYYEQDPESWWSSASKVLKKLTNEVTPRRIKAVAISNQRETFAVLDENGKKLRNAILWLDERCKDITQSFAEEFGVRRLHRITGKPVDYAPIVYRLAWLKKYEPDVYKKIAKVCDVHSYLAWKLTNTFSASWTSADPTGLYDLKNKKWSVHLLDSLGLSVKELPDVYKPGSIIGEISTTAAVKTGLLAGTPVIAAGGDGQSAGLGANILSPGTAYLNLGTAVVAGVYGKDYKTSKAYRTMIACSDEGYIYESSLRAGTFAVDWFIKNILRIDSRKYPGIYNSLRKEAEDENTGSNGLLFIPHLNGAMNPYWDINARGAFIGLSSSHKRGQMFRAILEGIAFEKHLALIEIEKNTGKRIDELVAIGGGASNKFWCRIFADITGKKILIPLQTEASALGAAIAAAAGTGWYKSMNSAAKKMTGVKEIIYPDPAVQKLYDRMFKAYRRIYSQIKSINSMLAKNN